MHILNVCVIKDKYKHALDFDVTPNHLLNIS